MSILQEHVYASDLLGSDSRYRLLLPDNYPGTSGRLPVLYLLHGLFGSFENWTDLTDLAELNMRSQLIIVMPDGSDAWYADSVGRGKYESHFIRELIPEIDANYWTAAHRDARFIAGNSMGGYGALRFGLRFPELFGFAGSLSGAFFSERHCGTAAAPGWSDVIPSLVSVFGNCGGARWLENEVQTIAEQAVTHNAELPYLYFDCGASDEFITVNRELSALFASLGIAHEYHEFDGSHEWQYWASRVHEVIDLIWRPFAGRRNI